MPSFAGTNIEIYQSRYPSTLDDLDQYLKRFSLHSVLRLIGKVSLSVASKGPQSSYLERIPLRNSSLAYLAMQAIKVSNDFRNSNFGIEELSKSLEIFYGIRDPIIEDKENYEGFMIRYGFFQLNQDRDSRVHQFSRAYQIYVEYWHRNSIEIDDINSISQKEFGLNIVEFMLLGLFFYTQCQEGFTNPINEDVSERFSHPKLQELLSQTNQEKFLKICSCKYHEFRNIYDDDNIEDKYRQFRFNPLYIKPLIRPDRNLNQSQTSILLSPVPRLVYEKSTNGLFHHFSELYRAKNSTSFRNDFGKVFEEYVFNLTKETIKGCSVTKEFEYSLGSNSKNSPDLILRKGNKAVLIEIKQACLYLSSKIYGVNHNISKDLKRTIGKGVNQLLKFKKDIDSKNYEELNTFFEGIENFEFLILTADRNEFLNSILKDFILLEYPEFNNQIDWQSIHIDEFENFISLAQDEIIDSLEEKRTNTETIAIPFKTYMSDKYSDKEFGNKCLLDTYNSICSDYGFLNLV